MGTSLPVTGTLRWGALCGAGKPCSSGVIPPAQIPLRIFICHMWVWDQLIPHLQSSYQSQCSFFFKSLVVVLLFLQISGGSEWCFFCSLVVILMWLWNDVSSAFTYTTLLTGSQRGASMFKCCLFLYLSNNLSVKL